MSNLPSPILKLNPGDIQPVISAAFDEVCPNLVLGGIYSNADQSKLTLLHITPPDTMLALRSKMCCEDELQEIKLLIAEAAPDIKLLGAHDLYFLVRHIVMIKKQNQELLQQYLGKYTLWEDSAVTEILSMVLSYNIGSWTREETEKAINPAILRLYLRYC